jgi:hypothetical protein
MKLKFLIKLAMWNYTMSLLQFMIFSIGFSNQKILKSDMRQKNHPINLDKSF